jgi:ribonuclease J
MVLLSDSTNVEMHGRTGGEDDLRPAFEEVLAKTPGRVVVSCFATSIPRIQRVADLAVAAGRSVAFIGRRMVDNAEIAMDLGLLRVPAPSLCAADRLQETLLPNEQLAFVAGSQGEPLSALSIVSLGEHRDLAVGPGDTVVLSARAIPGNERTVSRLISNLYRRGCQVVHPGVARVHVSGHGSQDDLLELCRLTRPRYVVPVHGEYRMLAQHKLLLGRNGFPAERVVVAEDGEALSFGPQGARKQERVDAGRVLLDRSGADGIEDVVVRERRHLSSDGVLVPVVVVDKNTGALESRPEIVSRGFMDRGPEAELMAEAGFVVADAVAARPPHERHDSELTKERVRQGLRRFLKRRTQRRPLVIPVVMEV